MNIIQLEVLLHFAYSPEPFHFQTQAVHIAQAICEREMLMEETTRSRVVNLDDKRIYYLTEKGRVFVNALLSTPLPVAAYVMPIPGEQTPGYVVMQETKK